MHSQVFDTRKLCMFASQHFRFTADEDTLGLLNLQFVSDISAWALLPFFTDYKVRTQVALFHSFVLLFHLKLFYYHVPSSADHLNSLKLYFKNAWWRRFWWNCGVCSSFTIEVLDRNNFILEYITPKFQSFFPVMYKCTVRSRHLKKETSGSEKREKKSPLREEERMSGLRRRFKATSAILRHPSSQNQTRANLSD